MALCLTLLSLPVLTAGCRGSESQAEQGKVRDVAKVVNVEVVEVTPGPFKMFWCCREKRKPGRMSL